MSRPRMILYCLLAAAVGILVGSRAWSTYMSAPPVAAAPAVTGQPSAIGIQTTFAPIVDKDLPAVVNISSARMVRNSVSPFFMDPFFRQFFGDDFGRQFGSPQTQRGLGSGVIVRPDGYILTNNHVIEGATDITVMLLDKRQFKAKVVGTDSKTDIGVLKIDAKNLPVLALGDSAKVRVGDLALAMGEPFGLGQTVTMGIISAKGRNGFADAAAIRISSRPTPPSIPATPAARWWTPAATSSASIRRFSHVVQAVAMKGSDSPFPSTWLIR